MSARLSGLAAEPRRTRLVRVSAALLVLSWSALTWTDSLAQGSPTEGEPHRAADQTYLTYPEWFLVYGPEEYADYVSTRPPTDFPFMAQVFQFWSGYIDVTRAVPEREPVNWGYHAMIWTIGLSTTVEYVVRAAYESSVGRITAATVIGETTHEDAYGARVAREYEQFLRQNAWYDFDYPAALRALWSDVPFTWTSPLRALERRYALTTEYTFKALYAHPLSALSHASFDEASFVATTEVRVRDLPSTFELAGPWELERVTHPDGTDSLLLPRYEAFMGAALRVASEGASFEEIAGNRGRILVSVRAPHGFMPGGRVLRRDPLSTTPSRERVVFDVPIAELADVLRELPSDVSLEHIYDF